MLQDTSLHAYALASQNLGAKQKQVLDGLRFFPEFRGQTDLTLSETVVD